MVGLPQGCDLASVLFFCCLICFGDLFQIMEKLNLNKNRNYFPSLFDLNWFSHHFFFLFLFNLFQNLETHFLISNFNYLISFFIKNFFLIPTKGMWIFSIERIQLERKKKKYKKIRVVLSVKVCGRISLFLMFICLMFIEWNYCGLWDYILF